MLKNQLTLSNSKFTSKISSPKLHASADSGVQRKLDMHNQVARKNDNKSLKSSGNQQKYRPPGKSNPISTNRVRATREVSDASEKLANMTIGPRKPTVPTVGLRPTAPMKAGVQWIGESGNVYLRPAQQIQPGRVYTRKVVG